MFMYFQNTTAQRNDTLLAIGTAYVQGEDVAARGRVLLYSVEKNSDSIQAKVACCFILDSCNEFLRDFFQSFIGLNCCLILPFLSLNFDA